MIGLVSLRDIRIGFKNRARLLAGRRVHDDHTAPVIRKRPAEHELVENWMSRYKTSLKATTLKGYLVTRSLRTRETKHGEKYWASVRCCACSHTGMATEDTPDAAVDAASDAFEGKPTGEPGTRIEDTLSRRELEVLREALAVAGEAYGQTN